MTKRNSRRSRRAPAVNSITIISVVAGLVALAAVVFIARQFFPSGSSGGAKQWSSPPAMGIDPTKSYTATVRTDKGDIVIELLPQTAPVTVNNFVFLARQGFYDGVTFHRVLPGFVAQGGDPSGTGSGGPGYFIPNEDSDLTFDGPGVVAMANSGRDRNGSQFFITLAPQPGLNGGYTIFGRVTSGMDVVESITPRDPSQNPNAPPGDKISSVTIEEK
ncbi:MAG: peptidylprolyl isomerase [Anaerolineales bacterium]